MLSLTEDIYDWPNFVVAEMAGGLMGGGLVGTGEQVEEEVRQGVWGQ